MRKYLAIVVILLSGCSVVSFHKLTSDLSGIVTKNGKPVEGAEILFRADSHWYGESEEKVVITGTNGEFEIPQWNLVRSLVLVHQPVIKQEIIIRFEGKAYEGWKYTRMSYTDSQDGANGSFLVCELGSVAAVQKVDGYRTASGICHAK